MRERERRRERARTRKSEIEIEKGAPIWLPLAFWDRMWTQVPAYRRDSTATRDFARFGKEGGE